MKVTRQSDELSVFSATIYAEARDQSPEGQEWVAWVIKYRAYLNRIYWGGNSIKSVCLEPGQFECWTGVQKIIMDEEKARDIAIRIARLVFNASINRNPTYENDLGPCDHYNNPAKEGYPQWTRNCIKVRKIDDHQFYKSNV